ncbi:hypothetical protein Tco_1258775, partial [Tanacetum coccineum]
YNWETATYGKIGYDEDVHDLRFIETEFPAIVFNEALTYEVTHSCEPTVSPLNNNKIDFRISFEESDDEDYTVIFDKNSFPAIVYNDALTSKSDSSTEPVEIPHRINEFDLKTKTSLSECDGEEQNVVYCNDLLPFNIIYPNDLESDKDNDDNEIDMALSPRDQRHQYLRFEGLQYTDADIADFETRLGKIYSRDVHRVLVLDFESLTVEMVEGLTSRMLMEHKDAHGQSVFTSHAWRRLFEASHEIEAIHFGFGITTAEEMQTTSFGLHWTESARLITYSIAGRSQVPEKVTVTDLFYLRGMDVGRKQGAMIFGGQFITRLAEHFGLLTEERLQGLAVIVRDLHIIDMAELTRLHICEELIDTWAWVALRPERQPDAVVGAPKIAEGALDVEKGDQAFPAPVSLGEQREVVDAMARDFSRFTIWVADGISQLLDSAGSTYVRYFETYVPIRDVGSDRGLVRPTLR